MIGLDLDVGDVLQGRINQPNNRGPADYRGIGKDEVIRRLGLELSRARASGECAEAPVGVTGGEEERIRPSGRR